MKKRFVLYVTLIITFTLSLSSCKKEEAAAPTFAPASVNLTIQIDDGKGNITPLPDADILLYTYAAYDIALNEDTDPKERKTDDDGKIAFDKLLVGAYYIYINGKNAQSFFLNAGENEITLTIPLK